MINIGQQQQYQQRPTSAGHSQLLRAQQLDQRRSLASMLLLLYIRINSVEAARSAAATIDSEEINASVERTMTVAPTACYRAVEFGACAAGGTSHNGRNNYRRPRRRRRRRRRREMRSVTCCTFVTARRTNATDARSCSSY